MDSSLGRHSSASRCANRSKPSAAAFGNAVPATSAVGIVPDPHPGAHSQRSPFPAAHPKFQPEAGPVSSSCSGIPDIPGFVAREPRGCSGAFWKWNIWARRLEGNSPIFGILGSAGMGGDTTLAGTPSMKSRGSGWDPRVGILAQNHYQKPSPNPNPIIFSGKHLNHTWGMLGLLWE